MIVLDTSVVSELMKRHPERRVVDWLDAQPAESVWTTAVTAFEVRFGLATLADGRRRRALLAAFEQALRSDLGGRVLDVSAAAAAEAARIAAALRKVGRPVDVRDVLIAGTVAAHRATLATRNVRHFAATGIGLADPWRAADAGHPRVGPRALQRHQPDGPVPVHGLDHALHERQPRRRRPGAGRDVGR